MRYLLFIILIGCTTLLSKAMPLNDSIHTFKQVLKVHISHPDSALRLLQTMDELHIEKKYLTDVHRALVYEGQNQNRLAADYVEKALAHDSLINHHTYYLQALSCATAVNQKLGRYKKCLQLLQKGISFARRVGNKTVEANLLFTSGTIYRLMNDSEEANRCFNKAIQMGEEAPAPKLKPFLSYFYGEMTSMMTDEGRYEEALDYCRKREALLQNLATFPKIPMGYMDQQYAYLYSKQACLLLKLHRTQEATVSYQKFMKTHMAQHPEGLSHILPYWMESKQCQKVIAYLQDINPGADTLNLDYAHRLKLLSDAYHELGQNDLAYHYQQRLTALNDSLHLQDKKDEMTELATIYQLKEKEFEIRQQQEKLERMVLVRNSIIGAFVLVCCLLWTMWHHLRTVQQKNQHMASSINNALQYEQKIESLEKEISEAQEKGTFPESVASSTDSIQFKRIIQLIKEEKLYLKPDLNRQEILDLLSIDKNYFARLMQENLQMSLPQYISNLRIKTSIELLKAHPNYTMQAIAEESGFNNLRNFQRLFKLTTGMTPTEYKNAVITKA